MPITPIQVNTQTQRKMSALEKIAMGLSIADKALELGLAYPRYKREQRTEQRAVDRDYWERVMQENSMRTNQERLDLERKRTGIELRELERKQQPLGEDQKAIFMDRWGQYGVTRPPETVGQAEELEPELVKIKMQMQRQSAGDYQRRYDEAAERERKAQEERDKLKIPGLGGQIPLNEKDRQDMVQALDAYGGAMEALKRMQALRDQYPKGIGLAVTKTQRDAQDYGRALAGELFGKLRQLSEIRGTLSEKTLEFLRKQVPEDPLDWSPILGASVQPKMDALGEKLRSDFVNVVQSRGLDPTPALQSLGMVTVRDKDGRVYAIPRERLKEAQAEGAKVVRVPQR